MPLPGNLLKKLATGVIVCGAAGVCLTAFNEELVEEPLAGASAHADALDADADLNVHLMVDYNLEKGENPQPCHDLLMQRMRSVPYGYVIPKPDELGVVSVQVDDDHADEALATFQSVLRDTKSPYQPVVRKW